MIVTPGNIHLATSIRFERGRLRFRRHTLAEFCERRFNVLLCRFASDIHSASDLRNLARTVAVMFQRFDLLQRERLRLQC